jgi:hypothetical protein
MLQLKFLLYYKLNERVPAERPFGNKKNNRILFKENPKILAKARGFR